MARISRKLRREICQRAGYLCEYCHLRQALCPEPFEVDHIIPRAVHGRTLLSNLCLACPVCNNAKQDQMNAIDPLSGKRVPLFHPRLQDWERHFGWSEDAGEVVGKTQMGRATIRALDMNHPRVVEIRRMWRALGLHPPE